MHKAFQVMKQTILSIMSLIVVTSCGSNRNYFPENSFDISKKIIPTDYSQLMHWAAHPDKEDTADKIPASDVLSDQSNLKADVFFIHPTTLTGHKGEVYWNAPINNTEINTRTDETTILYQASIFNTVGKVYAPRYQQAHLHAYFTKDKASGHRALDWAYEDVKAAFQYYIKHHNNGRPFILASHSQGTTHAKRLIKEFIDGQQLQQQLIAAYLVGIIIKKDEFTNIIPCESPEDTGCTISWRTFRKDIEPENVLTSDTFLVTNPLSWKTDTTYIPKSENKGAVLRNIDKIYEELVDAQVDQGILKVTKPRFFGSIFYNTKNYHIPDMNFFYFNIKENAELRTKTYLDNH